jgi:hypothetical protein
MNGELWSQFMKENGTSIKAQLFQMHYKIATLQDLKNPPFTHTIPLYNDIGRFRFPDNETDLVIFVKICYSKFVDLNPHGKGTVDFNPRAWVEVAIQVIRKSVNKGLSSVSFPNGCCTRSDCSLNLMYEVVLNELCQP